MHDRERQPFEASHPDEPRLDVLAVDTDRQVHEGHNAEGQQRERRRDGVGDDEHRNQRQGALDQRGDRDGHRAHVMGLEVDPIDEIAEVAVVVERLREANTMGEEVTAELERHPLLEARVDVAVNHPDDAVEQDDTDAQAHGEHDQAVG